MYGFVGFSNSTFSLVLKTEDMPLYTTVIFLLTIENSFINSFLAESLTVRICKHFFATLGTTKLYTVLKLLEKVSLYNLKATS